MFFHLVTGFSNRFKDGFYMYIYIYRTFNCSRIFFPKKTELVKGLPGYKHGGPAMPGVPFPWVSPVSPRRNSWAPSAHILAWRPGFKKMWSRGDSSWLFGGYCGYWNTIYDLSNCKWSIIKVLIRCSIVSFFCQIHVEDAYYKCVLQGHMKALSSPHTIILGVWVVKFCNKQRYRHFDTFLIHYSALLLILSILTAARDCSVPWNVSLCSCRCLHWGVGSLFEREC